MRIVLYLLVSLLFLFWVTPVRASDVLFQDNFDDGSATDWTIQRDMQWNNPTQPCMDGTQPAAWTVVDGELGITINGGPSCTTSITPNALDLTHQGSFVFSFDWHFQESMSMDRNVALLWQDANNWYGVKIINNEVRIEKVVNGREADVANNYTTYQFAADRRYHFDLTVRDDNSIIVAVDGQEILHAQDQLPFIRGFKTVGLMASTGAIRRSLSYFDNVKVVGLDNAQDTDLHVPLVKQVDPTWKNFAYDHADQWSTTPTIGRFGCALTSMVMILQYYGIDHLPNGQFITPYTLDIWLRSQPDGYIGQGSVNWLAATRLTKLVSDTLKTPALEFKWANYSFDVLKTEIANQRPVILNIPGHFIVGDGFTHTDDVLIRDPFYSYTLLSQHKVTPSSMRMFLPSHTDLSYILVVAPPGVDVTVAAPDGKTVVQQTAESISDPTDGATGKTTETTLTYVAKPPPGIYSIVAHSKNNSPSQIQIFTYDKQGAVTLYTHTVSGSQLLQLTIDSNTQSALKPLTIRYVTIVMDRLFTQRDSDADNRQRYTALIQQQCASLSNYFYPRTS